MTRTKFFFLLKTKANSTHAISRACRPSDGNQSAPTCTKEHLKFSPGLKLISSFLLPDAYLPRLLNRSIQNLLLVTSYTLGRRFIGSLNPSFGRSKRFVVGIKITQIAYVIIKRVSHCKFFGKLFSYRPNWCFEVSTVKIFFLKFSCFSPGLRKNSRCQIWLVN